MKLLCELSGEHPTLPFAELECVGSVVESRRQVAVVESHRPESAVRLALTRTVSECLGACDPDIDSIKALLSDLAITTDHPFCARVRKIHGTALGESQLELERLLGSMITGTVSLTAPAVEYRLIASGDRCYLGRVLYSIPRGAFDARNPMRRPFFHPGVMMPAMARAMVNLTLVREGERIADPFCGTGGLLLEAWCIGACAVGSDFDPAMLSGSRDNLPRGADLVLADASHLPLIDHSVEAVATDLPYGQSVRIHGTSIDGLYSGALQEIARVLSPGRRAVVVSHRDIRQIAEEWFDLLQFHEQRVHRSLTRRIMVLVPGAGPDR